MNYNTETQTEAFVELLEEKIDEFSLVLYNDDYNTFDHVINCLMR